MDPLYPCVSLADSLLELKRSYLHIDHHVKVHENARDGHMGINDHAFAGLQGFDSFLCFLILFRDERRDVRPIRVLLATKSPKDVYMFPDKRT